MICLVRGSCGTVTTIRGSDTVIVAGVAGRASHFDADDDAVPSIFVVITSSGVVCITGVDIRGSIAGGGIGGKGGFLTGTDTGVELIFTALPQFRTIADPSNSYSCNSDYNKNKSGALV